MPSKLHKSIKVHDGPFLPETTLRNAGKLDYKRINRGPPHPKISPCALGQSPYSRERLDNKQYFEV